MAKKIISLLLCVILLLGVASLFSACNIQMVGRTYYISSSTGNDANDAKTENTAWKTFANLKNTVLKEGDRVLLKRGDEWNERLEIYGGGSEAHRALVSSYGDKSAPKPIVRLNNGINDICMLVSDVRYDANAQNQVNNCSNLTIEELDLRSAYLGIYFRTLVYHCNNLTVRNVDISEIWCDEVLSKMSSANGGGPTTDAYYAGLPKANLPLVTINPDAPYDTPQKVSSVQATGGGANEWLIASAVLFTGGWTNLEFGNIIMNNAVNGLELIASYDIWVHDVVAAGGLPFRSQQCHDVTLERVRCLQTHETYTFWGGITGSYFGATTRALLKDSEMSYVWRNGENDGCGLDYETQCWSVATQNSVFHHNDSGSLLIMELPETNLHENVSFDYNLCYNNIRDAKSDTYNYEVLMRNHGTNNISISYNDFFTRASNGWGQIYYIGCKEDKVAASTIKEGNNQNSVNNYRTRFAFNSSSNEGWSLYNGLGAYGIEDGVLKIVTNANKTGAVVLNNRINGLCYKKMFFKVTNDVKGTLQVQYTLPDGTVEKSEAVKINGAGDYIVSLPENLASIIDDVAIIFTSNKANQQLHIDYAQFILDMNATAKKAGNNAIDITFGGTSTPFISDSINTSNIAINGYTVSGINKTSYNTVRVTVNEAVSDLTNLSVTADAELFIPYFADIINGLDCDRTAAQDASLLGGAVQSFYYNGSLTLICK